VIKHLATLTTISLVLLMTACGGPPDGGPPGGPPPADTSAVYVGQIDGSDALIAIVVEGDGFAAYTCGGEATWELLTGWYSGGIEGNRIDAVVGTTGWQLDATLADGSWTGTLTRLDERFDVRAELAAPGTAAGLYLLDTANREAGLIIDNDLNTAGVYYGKSSGETSTVRVRDDVEEDAGERESVSVETDAYGGSTYTLSRTERTFDRAMFTVSMASTRPSFDQRRSASVDIIITPLHGFSGEVTLAWANPEVSIEPASVSLPGSASVTVEAFITVDAQTLERDFDTVLAATSSNLAQFQAVDIGLPTPEPWWHADAFEGEYGNSRANDITTDAAGFSYVVGTVWQGVDPDVPESGGFVARYNPEGERVWLHMLEGGNPRAVEPGPAGTVYIAGYVLPNDEDWPGEPVAGTQAAFLLRMSADGQVQWRRVLQGSGFPYWKATQLAVDASGNAVAVGFASTASAREAFVARVTGEGALLWTTLLDSGERDHASSVAVDDSGNAYVSGRWNDAVVNGTPEPEERGVGFLAKLDAGGDELWLRPFDSGHDAGSNFSSVDLDAHGRPVVGGRYGYFVSGDPFSWSNGVVARYDQDGELLWSRSISSIDDGAPTRCWSSAHNTGAPACSAVRAVRVLSGGLIYAAGRTSGWLTEAGEHNAGTVDSFVAGFSASGDPLFHHVVGSSDGHDELRGSLRLGGGGLGVDLAGNAYLTGSTLYGASNLRAFVLMLEP